VTFDVYDQETGGVLLWTDAWTLDLASGRVDVLLGSADPPNPIPAVLFAAPDRWIQVTVQPSGGSASVLEPRQRLVSVPYSLGTERLGTMTLPEVQADVDARIAAHALLPSAHHVKTTDASELTSGTLDNARLNMGPGGGIDADTLDGMDSSDLCLGLACSRTPQQIAMLRWYEANQSGIEIPTDVPTGDYPIGIAFDGENIWIANTGSDRLTSLRASDGALLDTIQVGDAPFFPVYDGENIWVTNSNAGTVSKVRIRDRTVMGPFPVGSDPQGIAFDGKFIWTANQASGDVTKLRASDGAVEFTTPYLGASPVDVEFDGQAVWVSLLGDDEVKKLDEDGAVLATTTVDNQPHSLEFDGSHMWVANRLDDTVMKLRLSDGVVVDTIQVAGGPVGLVFDGSSMWVSSGDSGTVTKLRASDGAVLVTIPGIPNAGSGMAFDGSSVWITDASAGTVRKL
jgi:DNA-binding beta-propeller fold protein YncE